MTQTWLITGSPESLMSGLKSLARDTLTNLTPHPFYAFLHYSHPPMRQRLTALAAKGRAVVADG